jgi:hypothetical protein
MLLRDGYADASIQHVPGEENLADALTRRSKRVKIIAALQWCGWELSKQVLRAPPAVDESEYDVFIAAIHNEMGHSGIEFPTFLTTFILAIHSISIASMSSMN